MSLLSLSNQDAYIAAGALCHAAESDFGRSDLLTALANKVVHSEQLENTDEIELVEFAIERTMKTLHSANVTVQPGFSVRAIMSKFGEYEVHGGRLLSVLNTVKTRLYDLKQEA